MSKWPKKWIDACYYAPVSGLVSAQLSQQESETVLENLHKAGALKDPPEIREWDACDRCGRMATKQHPFAFNTDQCPGSKDGLHYRVTVREVKDE